MLSARRAVPGLSAAFASILHSNRAAAHQGLAQWAQAVADCCRSKALAPAYVKVLLGTAPSVPA